MALYTRSFGAPLLTVLPVTREIQDIQASGGTSRPATAPINLQEAAAFLSSMGFNIIGDASLKTAAESYATSRGYPSNEQGTAFIQADIDAWKAGLATAGIQTGTQTASLTPPPAPVGTSSILLYGAVAVGAYFLFFKKGA